MIFLFFFLKLAYNIELSYTWLQNFPTICYWLTWLQMQVQYYILSRLRYGSVKVCIRMELSLVCESPTAMRAASRLRMTLMEVNLNQYHQKHLCKLNGICSKWLLSKGLPTLNQEFVSSKRGVFFLFKSIIYNNFHNNDSVAQTE